MTTLIDAIEQSNALNKFSILCDWRRARIMSDLAIAKAGHYVPWGKNPNARYWQLSLNLSRNAMKQCAISNVQFWNRRNPHPYLP